MIAFFAENLAPLMFLSLVVVLLLGYPVAFALAFVGFVFGFIGIELGLLPVNLFGAIPDRIFGQMSNETLLAIPFFTFMGLVLERSGMAEDLLDTIGQLFGPVRGGLAFAVIIVGALLAATTGVVAASVISMGLISLPIMLRYGYDRKVAAGTIAASGTLAQIIPPSLVLIVLADQLGRSVGDMYKGALVPGLMLVGFYCAFIIGMSIFRPMTVPALPLHARTLKGWKLVQRVVFSLVPAACIDLSCSWNNLYRPCDAYGRRCYGSDGSTASSYHQPPAQSDDADFSSLRDRKTVVIRYLHLVRRTRFLAHILWCQRPCLG